MRKINFLDPAIDFSDLVDRTRGAEIEGLVKSEHSNEVTQD